MAVQDKKLKTNVFNLRTEVKQFTPFFNTHSSVKLLETQLDFVEPFLISYLNEMGEIGLDLESMVP
jgi:hypothetical protein